MYVLNNMSMIINLAHQDK